MAKPKDLKDFRVGPGDAAASAAVPIRTLSAWMARYYVGPPSVGPGRSRPFEPLDIIRLGVAAELVRIGVAIGIAARLVEAVDKLPGETALLAVFTEKPGSQAEPVSEYKASIKSPEELAAWMEGLSKRGYAIATVDVAACAKRAVDVLTILEESRRPRGRRPSAVRVAA